MNNRKEEQYELTSYGKLGLLLTDGEQDSLKILNELELIGRRKGYEHPAILLNGKDSEIIDVVYKKEKKSGKTQRKQK